MLLAEVTLSVLSIVPRENGITSMEDIEIGTK